MYVIYVLLSILRMGLIICGTKIKFIRKRNKKMLAYL